MIIIQQTIICDKCEEEEHFEGIKLLTAIRQLRESGWTIVYIDGGAICPSCAT